MDQTQYPDDAAIAQDGEGSDADQRRKGFLGKLRVLFAAFSGVWAKRAGTLVLFILATLLLLPTPRSVAGTDADSSWCAVLNYAHAKGWQFGTDINFTYGPAGFLISPWATGQPYGLRLLSDLFLSSMAAGGLCLLAWRSRLLRWVTPFATVLLLAPNINPRADLLIYIGLLSWGTLSFFKSGPSLLVSLLCLTTLAAFIAPIKMTFLVAGAMTVSAVAVELMLRRRLIVALAITAGFFGMFAFEWTLLGQDWSHLGSFLRNGLAISAPYGEVMTKQALPGVNWGAIEVAVGAVLLTLAATLTFSGAALNSSSYKRRLLLLWLGSLLLLTWKHGLVRADRFHVGYFLCFVPALVLALEAVPSASSAGKKCLGLLGPFCCVLSALTLQVAFVPGFLKDCVRHAPQLLAENARTLLNPTEYAQSMDRKLDLERKETSLPRVREVVGTGSIDVFSDNQSYCWYNRFNYHPRPIFQSYSVYSPALARENEHFFLSKSAPEYVLFKLTGLDQRFAPLEDSLVLRDTLANYALVGQEESCLLLKQQRTAPLNLSLLDWGALGPGKHLKLPQVTGDLWLEVDLEPSLAGRAVQFAYKAPDVRLAFWDKSAAKLAEYRAPPLMMKAGFIVSPLLQSTADVVNLYAGAANSTTRPGAVSLELPEGTAPLWHNLASYRLYALKEKLGAFTASDFQDSYARSQQKGAAAGVAKSANTDGNGS